MDLATLFSAFTGRLTAKKPQLEKRLGDWSDPKQRKYIAQELRYRKLPQPGSISASIELLNASNDLSITKDGRALEHESQKQEFDRTAASRIVTFPRFPTFPKEIRDVIWDLSLPGPRVLVALPGLTGSHDPIRFAKEGQAAKPAQLDTCREARDAALKRYKLCFNNNPNIYADLAGGDILYFSSDFLRSTFDPGQIILQDVKHVALSRELWASYEGQSVTGKNGTLLRKSFIPFKGLERVSLVSVTSEICDQVFAGHLDIDDPFYEHPPEIFNPRVMEDFGVDLDVGWGWSEEYTKWKKERTELRGDWSAWKVLRSFDLGDLAEEEVKEGIPKSRLIRIKYVLEKPLRILESPRAARITQSQ